MKWQPFYPQYDKLIDPRPPFQEQTSTGTRSAACCRLAKHKHTADDKWTTSQEVNAMTSQQYGCHIVWGLISWVFKSTWPCNECQRTWLMLSQHWFRLQVGAVKQQAITWTNVDPVPCHHKVSPGHYVSTQWVLNNMATILPTISRKLLYLHSNLI